MTQRRTASLLLAPVAALLLAACGPSGKATDLRQWTNDLAFRISVDPMPPRAEDVATFKVVVRDKESGQPIEMGQGRIFATSRDQARTADGLRKGKEVGTYYARIRFVTAGDWAMGLQFRRDSASALQRTNDWVQSVAPSTGPVQ